VGWTTGVRAGRGLGLMLVAEQRGRMGGVKNIGWPGRSLEFWGKRWNCFGWLTVDIRGCSFGQGWRTFPMY